MKILYIYPFCGLGGVETSIINKMQSMNKLGIYSEALLLNFYGEGGTILTKNSHINASPSIDDLINVINKNFDVISIIDFPQFFRALNILQINSKIIYETHCSDLPSMRRNYKIMNSEKISAIIVPSDFNKNMIKKLVRTDKKVFVLPNPINMALFRNIPLSKLLEKDKELIDKKNIIWVGRLQGSKNPVEFIRLGLRLLKKDMNFHFTLVGDICGDYQFFNFIKSNIPPNYKPKFSFIHSVPNEEMPEIYSLAANTGGCLVSTSNNESLPMIFLEAISCRCPIVSTNVGGIGDIIINNSTGKIYPLNNINEGFNAIYDLVDEKNKVKRNKIINNAYSLVKSRHSFEKVSENYKHIINMIFN